jgi:hypothetical protein
MAKRISASGCIMSEGVQNFEEHLSTAASLSHQRFTSDGLIPRYSICERLRKIPSSSLRYDEREEIPERRKHADAKLPSASWIIQAHVAVCLSR